MLACDAGQRRGDRGRPPDVSGDNLEHQPVHHPISRGRKVPQALKSSGHPVDKLARAIELAKRPEHDGEIGRGGNADILAEAKGEIAVSLRIEDRQRLLEMPASVDETAGKPFRRAEGPMRHAGLPRMRLRRAIGK